MHKYELALTFFLSESKIKPIQSFKACSDLNNDKIKSCKNSMTLFTMHIDCHRYYMWLMHLFYEVAQ